MSSRTLTFVGFGAWLAAFVLWAVLSARHDHWMDLREAVAALVRRRAVRIAVVAWWAWLGWHLFARGSGAFD